jgi:hypothetical protein
MPLHRRPNPTDPGDAADLSTPQGIVGAGSASGGSGSNRPGSGQTIEKPPEINERRPVSAGNLPLA